MKNSQEQVHQKVNIAIFASGMGSNAEAIIHESLRDDTPFCVALMVSNNSRCGAMNMALMFDIPIFHISSQTNPEPENYAKTLLLALQKHSIDIIALAGYMKKLPQNVISEYQRQIFNIHPALLPKFGGEGMYGLNVHRAVLEAGERESGATVHEVETEYDTGKIVAQDRIPIFPDDTPESLSERVKEVEYQIFPRVIREKARQILQTK